MTNEIRHGIEKIGFHALFRNELRKFWNPSDDLSDEEKAQRIRAFAQESGFQVRVAGNLSLAIFTVSDALR